MDCTSTLIPYHKTAAFSSIVLDYIDGSPKLADFAGFPPTAAGLQKAILARQKFPTNRQLLVDELKKQYSGVPTISKVEQNIEALLSPDTFTVTTAHQNNIFTGPLYFIYKILHVIKLAGHLNSSFTGYKFVPVYYIGSEDADLDELNHIYLDGNKLSWNTSQKGAVGRMKIDKDFIKLIDAIDGQLGVMPHGRQTMDLIRQCYRMGEEVQTATFRIVNALFAEYGLVVLIPDNARLKQQMQHVFEDDLLKQTASGIVAETSGKLGELYKVQAHPRDINLFYLKDNLRERIELRDSNYEVLHSTIKFSPDTLLKELTEHPERFSPNVILRGLYQETILPNIAFIGGGGEVGYWLELKKLFEHYNTPYPVLVLRNSFLIIEKKWQDKINKLGFTPEEIFLPGQEIINLFVSRETDKQLELNGTLLATEQLYETIKKQASSIDVTLEKHVESLKTSSIQRLRELEKKMLRAEKRKFEDQKQRIDSIKNKLFPGTGLQERYDNLFYYYAKWGPSIIHKLAEHSLALEQKFSVLSFSE